MNAPLIHEGPLGPLSAVPSWWVAARSCSYRQDGHFTPCKSKSSRGEIAAFALLSCELKRVSFHSVATATVPRGVLCDLRSLTPKDDFCLLWSFSEARADTTTLYGVIILATITERFKETVTCKHRQSIHHFRHLFRAKWQRLLDPAYQTWGFAAVLPFEIKKLMNK